MRLIKLLNMAGFTNSRTARFHSSLFLATHSRLLYDTIFLRQNTGLAYNNNSRKWLKKCYRQGEFSRVSNRRKDDIWRAHVLFLFLRALGVFFFLIVLTWAVSSSLPLCQWWGCKSCALHAPAAATDRWASASGRCSAGGDRVPLHGAGTDTLLGDFEHTPLPQTPQRPSYWASFLNASGTAGTKKDRSNALYTWRLVKGYVCNRHQAET